MFSSLIVDGLEGEWQLPSYSNQMVSGLVHCRDAADDWIECIDLLQSGHCYENHELEQHQWIAGLLITRAFLLCTHVHLVTQESQLCSCLRKCK